MSDRIVFVSSHWVDVTLRKKCASIGNTTILIISLTLYLSAERSNGFPSISFCHQNAASEQIKIEFTESG